VTVPAGSSDTDLTIQRFVEQQLCFTGLDTSIPPSLMVTTPGGHPETIPLTAFASKWDVMLFPVPGQGAEASLGEYSFRVTTPTPVSASTSPTAGSTSTSPTAGSASTSPTAGSTSTSPTAGVVTTSGHFTVVPDTQSSAEVGGVPIVEAKYVYLPVGSQLYIWFSGYPSLWAVYVSLYGPCAAQKCPLRADLPVVRMDQYGEGTATWAIPSSEAVGEYLIWIDPPPGGAKNPCLVFNITR
jgi:hypothetical protein